MPSRQRRSFSPTIAPCVPVKSTLTIDPDTNIDIDIDTPSATPSLASSAPSSTSISDLSASASPSDSHFQSSAYLRRRIAPSLSALQHEKVAKTPFSPKAPTAGRMFSSRKYTPLPTSSNGQNRKRAGGGLSSWKRWAILGTVTLIVLGAGYHRYAGSPYSSDTIWDDESEHTYSLVACLLSQTIY